jgi:hypothetical protein
MCVDHSINCSCGKNHASFNFRDEILPVEVISKLHCPACSQGVRHDPSTMLADNGWIIEFDMDVARFMLSKVASTSRVTPEFVFDEGYCTWRGMTPSDHIDSVRERETLAHLARTDRKRYFEEMRVWANTRMDRLAREGWRKAHESEPVGT